jgi:hypothetical protein
MNQNQHDDDPVIDEIREVRHSVSERFGHDPARLVAYYIDLQERQFKHRLIDRSGTTKPADRSVA